MTKTTHAGKTKITQIGNLELRNRYTEEDLDDAYNRGYSDGNADGYDNGYQDGYNEGLEQGYAEAT